MAVISVNYNSDKYLGVVIHYYKDNMTAEQKFNTGNFVKDWYAANSLFSKEISQWDEDESNKIISSTDSVRMFVQDGRETLYKVAFLTITDDVPALSYPSNSSEEMKLRFRRAVELYVPTKKTWTWDEYKKYCKK